MATTRRWIVFTAVLQTLACTFLVTGIPVPEGNELIGGDGQFPAMAPPLPDEAPVMETLRDANGDQMFPANMPNPPPGALNDGGIPMAPTYERRVPDNGDQMFPANMPNPPPGALNDSGIPMAPTYERPVPDNGDQMFPANMPNPPPGAVSDGGMDMASFSKKPVPSQGMFPPNMPPPPPGAFNDGPSSPSLPQSKPRIVELQPQKQNSYSPAVLPNGAVKPNYLNGDVPDNIVPDVVQGAYQPEGPVIQPVAIANPKIPVRNKNINEGEAQINANNGQENTKTSESYDHPTNAEEQDDSESVDNSEWDYFNYMESSDSEGYLSDDPGHEELSEDWYIDEDSDSVDSSDFYKWIFGDGDSAVWEDDEDKEVNTMEDEETHRPDALVPVKPFQGSNAVFLENDVPESGTRLVLYCIPAVILTLLIFLAWRNYGGRIKVVGIPTGVNRQHEWRKGTKSKEQIEPLLIANERDD